MQAFSAGDTILSQGALVGEDDFMYLLQSGEVDIVISGGQVSSEEHKVRTRTTYALHSLPSRTAAIVSIVCMLPISLGSMQCHLLAAIGHMRDKAAARRRHDCHGCRGKVTSPRSASSRGGCSGMWRCCLHLRALPALLQPPTSPSGPWTADPSSRLAAPCRAQQQHATKSP